MVDTMPVSASLSQTCEELVRNAGPHSLAELKAIEFKMYMSILKREHPQLTSIYYIKYIFVLLHEGLINDAVSMAADPAVYGLPGVQGTRSAIQAFASENAAEIQAITTMGWDSDTKSVVLAVVQFYFEKQAEKIANSYNKIKVSMARTYLGDNAAPLLEKLGFVHEGDLFIASKASNASPPRNQKTIKELETLNRVASILDQPLPHKIRPTPKLKQNHPAPEFPSPLPPSFKNRPRRQGLPSEALFSRKWRQDDGAFSDQP